MALSGLTANFQALLNWLATRSNGDVFAESEFRDAYNVINAFTFGSGDNEINEIFVDQRTVSLATPTDDLDLAGFLTNVFGDLIAFTTVKAIAIVNLAATSGENLKVGGKSGNGWIAPFGASSSYYDTIYAGSGLWIRTAPLSGFTVTSGSSDVLRVSHNGSLGDITYTVIILGVQ